MIEWLESIDRTLFFFINEKHNATWDVIMKNISGNWQWIPVYLWILIVAFWKLGWKKALVFILCLAVSVGLADLISFEVFKEGIKRYRPGHNLEIMDRVHLVKKANGEWDRGGMYGFVSSHAANFFAIATMVAFSFKWNRLWFFGAYFFAALVGYSRIYLGRHYPSDVVCGAILGCVIAYGGYVTYVQISKRLKLN